MAIARSMGVTFPESPYKMLDLPRVPYKKPVKKLPPPPAKPGEVILENTTLRDAAMVMAIVANKLNTEPANLRFKSIRQIF